MTPTACVSTYLQETVDLHGAVLHGEDVHNILRIHAEVRSS
jgi:hypothetical protein